MEFLLSHWHCILPVVGIAVAMIFMRDKPKDKNKKGENRQKKLPGRYDENNI